MKKKAGMKRKSVWLLIAIAFASMLTGCKTRTPAPLPAEDASGVMQEAFDISAKAEAYARTLFEEMLLEKGITQYEIVLSSGGFVTEDPLVFLAGYRYTYDGKEAVYGYKLRLNEDGGRFTVLEEGSETGEFIVGQEEEADPSQSE